MSGTGKIVLPRKTVDQLHSVLQSLAEIATTAEAEKAEDPDTHEEKHPDFVVLSEHDVKEQKHIFGCFDVDDSGQLAQLEVKRMLNAMKLFKTEAELVQVLKEMDEDNSGTVDLFEYLTFLDDKCAADPEFHQHYRALSSKTKLGFDGTTWRKHANISWLGTGGIIVLACLGVLAAVIWFRFILVPLTMAYFMTFLLGPIQDTLIQRPAICCGFVLCDDPGIRPALDQNASCCGKTMRWEDGKPDGSPYKTPLQRWSDHSFVKEEGQWDSNKNIIRWRSDAVDRSCCYHTPPKAWSEHPTEGSVLKKLAYDIFAIGKLPESLSVLVTLALAAAVLAAVILAVAAEISEVVADPDFQHSLKQAVIDINEALKLDYGISIEELANVNASNNNTVQNMTLEQVSQTAEPFIMVINDIVITLLLCLYMLSTREPEAEEDLFKEIQVMSMFEKIKFKVKHYVVLKTALSALTGGAVGIILGLCQVRLFVLFGLLTFLFNYIPNVGSMIAMVLPIPIIVVDTLPEDDFPGPEILRKAMAFLGPAIVQAYVGNVLEPAVFGKSLNVTAISVLIALVLWGAIWGLQGAILSVPLLAAVKVMLEEADHPMAKMALRSIRESASVDDAMEAKKSKAQRDNETSGAKADPGSSQESSHIKMPLVFSNPFHKSHESQPE